MAAAMRPIANAEHVPGDQDACARRAIARLCAPYNYLAVWTRWAARRNVSSCCALNITGESRMFAGILWLTFR
jgi:hypothetical protein